MGTEWNESGLQSTILMWEGVKLNAILFPGLCSSVSPDAAAYYLELTREIICAWETPSSSTVDPSRGA